MSSKKPRVLVVDDDPGIRKLVEYNLGLEGYDVLVASGGKEALRRAQNETPDLVLLDVMMPDLNGLRVCQTLRATSQVPIIMLTAKTGEENVLKGFGLGADDYVTKPFSPRELTARVRAVLRRAGQAAPEPDLLRAADVTLDRAGHTVRVGERLADLTPSEFDLLAALMSAPGRAFSRLELLDRLQGTTYEGYERTIDVHVKNLRAKIEPDPSKPRYVETVYGVGYRFAPEQ